MRLNILIYIHLIFFSIFLLVIINNLFILFIYINGYQFISIDALIIFFIYILNFLCKKNIKITCLTGFIFLKKTAWVKTYIFSSRNPRRLKKLRLLFTIHTRKRKSKICLDSYPSLIVKAWGMVGNGGEQRPVFPCSLGF